MTPVDARRREFLTHTLILIGTALAARLAFLAWLPAATYSDDVDRWLMVYLLLSSGRNPYNVSDALNWASFWMQIVFVIGGLARATGLDFVTVLRIVLMGVEVGVLVCAYALMRRF